MHAVGTENFGDLLRRHRLAAGLTQEAPAERAGLSARDHRPGAGSRAGAPYRDTVRMLADALRLDDRERATFEATARIFTAAWDEGCALTLDAAVELALQQPNGEPPAALE